jgi:ATP diphosphatase
MFMTRNADLSGLTDIMARLRNPATGCAWDRAQTFSTIAPYTIEEAYEVADAIEVNDLAALRHELGDLLLQVVFHARIAEEIGAFNLDDVIAGICDKMTRRHPHVFGDADVSPGWEAIKASERSGGIDASALAGVARAMPALLRATKIQGRAARAGFDWPDAAGPRAKILEEVQEVEEANTSEEREDEIGDVFFAVVNWARHKGVDPETALRRATDKFERRFRHMEDAAGPAFASLAPERKEALWAAAKSQERPAP